MKNQEVWKDVLGFEGYYQVSNLGRVRSLDRVVPHPVSIQKTVKGRMLRPGMKGGGYYHVNLMRNGKQYAKQLHRLVLESFVEPCPEGMECCHRDSDKSNNVLSNLRWGTHVSNCLDRSVSNRKGQKLTGEEVKEILRLEGILPRKDVAKRFDVTPVIIGMIYRKQIWKHIVLESAA